MIIPVTCPTCHNAIRVDENKLSKDRSYVISSIGIKCEHYNTIYPSGEQIASTSDFNTHNSSGGS